MEEGDFPFKHERGRKFNVQSSNTLRAHPWVNRLRQPDLVHPNPPGSFCRDQAVSLDKHKRWEQLENDQLKQAEWQAIYKRFGQDPDDYDPNTHIVEKFVWPARTFVVINGKNINQSGKMSAPRIDEPTQHENPSKTVSRAARKREEQRKKAQRVVLEPKEGQTYWEVQRNKPDMKKIHENQSSVEKWGKVDSKSRRLERKKDIKKLV